MSQESKSVLDTILTMDGDPNVVVSEFPTDEQLAPYAERATTKERNRLHLSRGIQNEGIERRLRKLHFPDGVEQYKQQLLEAAKNRYGNRETT